MKKISRIKEEKTPLLYICKFTNNFFRKKIIYIRGKVRILHMY